MRHSHKLLLIFAISVLLVVTALYGYMYHAMSVSVTKAALARDVVLTAQNDQTQAKKISTIVQDTVFDRNRLPTLFISSDDVVSFITSIESLGKQSGTKISIDNIDADKFSASAPGTVAKIRAHISAAGQWSAVMKLLALVERMPFATTISHVRLNGSVSDTKTGPIWSIAFDVQTPVLIAEVASSTP